MRHLLRMHSRAQRQYFFELLWSLPPVLGKPVRHVNELCLKRCWPPIHPDNSTIPNTPILPGNLPTYGLRIRMDLDYMAGFMRGSRATDATRPADAERAKALAVGYASRFSHRKWTAMSISVKSPVSYCKSCFRQLHTLAGIW